MSAMSRPSDQSKWIKAVLIFAFFIFSILCVYTLWGNQDYGIGVEQYQEYREYQHPDLHPDQYSDQDWLLTNMLGNITEALNQYPHITYWLEFGTALGVIRDGGVIPGDHDADISILGDEKVMEEVFTILRKHLNDEHRIEVWRSYDDITTTDWPRDDTLKHPDVINQIDLSVCRGMLSCHNPDIDIYNYGQHNGYLWRTDCFSNYTMEGIHSRYVPRRMGYDPVPIEDILPVRKMKYGPRQITVPVPNNVVPYLKKRYGFLGRNAKLDSATGRYVERKE